MKPDREAWRKMKVEPYRELDSKDELFPLIDQALWELLNPIEFEEEIKADPRLKHSPVGYAAIKDGHIVGFVGVMDMVTRSLNGSEMKVGGVWDVATHPAHTRKGVATHLMQRAHQYFQERGYLFSLLTTGRDSIAYQLYRKVGYQEALTFPSAYKLIRKGEKSAERASVKKKPDWDRILEIHRRATADRTGLVIRSKEYMNMLELRKIIHPEKIIQTEEGYALIGALSGSSLCWRRKRFSLGTVEVAKRVEPSVRILRGRTFLERFVPPWSSDLK